MPSYIPNDDEENNSPTFGIPIITHYDLMSHIPNHWMGTLFVG